jgi:hypothetical protein
MAIAVKSFGPMFETDSYWHILIGQDILANGRFTGDPAVVFGPSVEGWVTSQWLSEVVMYWLWSSFGSHGIVAFRMVGSVLFVGALLWAVTVVQPRGWGRPWRLLVASLLVGLVIPIIPLQERPQLVSYFLLPIVVVWALRLYYTGRWPNPFVIFVVAVVWVNSHGAALLLPALLLAAGVGHALFARLGWVGWGQWSWRGLWVIPAAVVGVLLSPLGVGIVSSARAIAAASNGTIIEWLRPSPLLVAVFLAPFALWLIWAVLAASRGRWRLVVMDALFLVPVAGYSLTANRMLPIGFLLATPLLARRLAQLLIFLGVGKSSESSLWPKLAVGVGVVGVGVVGVGVGTAVASEPQDTPVRIFEGLAATEGTRNVVADYRLTGRVQLLTQPAVATAIDGRTDRYGRERIIDYVNMLNADPGWQATWEDYASATDAVLSAGYGLVPELEAQGWVRVMADGDFVWLVSPDTPLPS